MEDLSLKLPMLTARIEWGTSNNCLLDGQSESALES